MIAIHGYADSINVRKVLWTAAELGLELELVERGTPARPAQAADYLAINPYGLVPLLEDGDFRLAESNSIIRYLCRRAGRPDLMPGAAVDAARVDQWIDWQATDFNDAWRYAFSALVRRKPGFDDPEQIESSRQAFNAKATIVAAQVERTSAFIAGSDFTLADVVIGLSVRRWYATPIEKPELPALDRYYARLCERPQFLPFGGPEAPA